MMRWLAASREELHIQRRLMDLRMNYVAKHDLTLFDLDLSDTKLLTLDLSHVNAGLKKCKVKPVVGVLGADVLWRHHAVVDYDRGLMLLSI